MLAGRTIFAVLVESGCKMAQPSKRESSTRNWHMMPARRTVTAWPGKIGASTEDLRKSCSSASSLLSRSLMPIEQSSRSQSAERGHCRATGEQPDCQVVNGCLWGGLAGIQYASVKLQLAKLSHQNAQAAFRLGSGYPMISIKSSSMEGRVSSGIRFVKA